MYLCWMAIWKTAVTFAMLRMQDSINYLGLPGYTKTSCIASPGSCGIFPLFSTCMMFCFELILLLGSLLKTKLGPSIWIIKQHTWVLFLIVLRPIYFFPLKANLSFSTVSQCQVKVINVIDHYFQHWDIYKDIKQQILSKGWKSTIEAWVWHCEYNGR